MVDLTELKTTANNMLWLAKHRQADFSAALVIAKLVLPVLRLIEVMEAHRGDRWRTLTEAMRESGRGRNYFEKPIAAAGGRSRLELWRDEGLADRTEEGIWLRVPNNTGSAGYKWLWQHHLYPTSCGRRLSRSCRPSPRSPRAGGRELRTERSLLGFCSCSGPASPGSTCRRRWGVGPA